MVTGIKEIVQSKLNSVVIVLQQNMRNVYPKTNMNLINK